MLKATYQSKDQSTELQLKGPMDEHAAKVLSDCLPAMGKQVKIDFAEVEYFNSLGIRAWFNFLKNLLDARKITYDKCPMHFIQQINMLPSLSRGVTIRSFFVDFECESCGFETKHLFLCGVSRENLQEQMDVLPCERCQGSLKSEEDPQILLQFMG